MKSLLCICILFLAAPCAAEEAVFRENSALHIVQNKEDTTNVVQKLQQTNEFNKVLIYFLLAFLYYLTFSKIWGDELSERIMQESVERNRIAALQTAIEGFEYELDRIGSELHGEAESRMSTAFLAFSSFQGVIFKHQPEEYKHFATSMASLGETIRTIMRQAEHLSPYGLKENGLALALKELVAAASRRAKGTPTNIALNVKVLRGKRFERHRELSVYRVVQAIVSNSLQYTQAESQWLLLTSQDNGRGFSTEDEEQNAFGLSFIRYRIHALGGTFHFNSADGYGTSMRAEIPMYQYSVSEP
jgi:signal transduction histidine kinase